MNLIHEQTRSQQESLYLKFLGRLFENFLPFGSVKGLSSLTVTKSISFFKMSICVRLGLPLVLLCPSTAIFIAPPYRIIYWSTLHMSKTTKDNFLSFCPQLAPLSQICSFLIIYFNISPLIHLIILISTTLIYGHVS